MKRLIVTLLVLGFLFIVGLQGAWSVVSLPYTHFSGVVQTTAGIGTGTLTFDNVWISMLIYKDGTSCFDSFCGPDEKIAGAKVTITGAIRESISPDTIIFTDAILSITDPIDSFTYFTADLSNIVFIKGGPQWYMNPQIDICKEETHNLSNIVVNTDVNHPSRFINEFRAGLETNDVSGIKLILLPYIGSFDGESISSILSGVIMGPPPVVEVDNLPRSIGYWKNHSENYCFAWDAASDEIDVLNVFSSPWQLWYSVTKVGKRTMEERALQQLAALLLNISAGLDMSTPLTARQLQYINPDYASILEGDGLEDTVGDAVIDIENAIRNSVDLERAKDLADAINNNSG